jgi:hypothetical protein
VEHACPSCGVAVKDGVPFCKNCGAPQIRVSVADPVMASPAYSSASSASPSVSAREFQLADKTRMVRPDAIDWSAALPAIGIAGLIVAVSLLFPLGMLGGAIIAAGTIASGYIAVGVYHRRRRSATVSRGTGARLGALSGAFGFLLSTVLFVAGAAATNSWDQVRDAVSRQIDATIARNPDPKLQEVANQIKAGDGFISIMIAGLLVTGLVLVIVSTLAGWMAARSLERRNRPGV